MKIIAHIHTDFPEKFGIPRQSGLAEGLTGRIIFTPEYRNADALRGLEGYSYIWLLWEFSEARRDTWSPTVRPPRLGGNTRMGVFATRSPFRPNPIGLSSVKLLGIEPDTPDGPVITVGGIDLMDGTPIYDIKPYIPYADSHPDAESGFSASEARLRVTVPGELLVLIPEDKRQGLIDALRQDPRPSYHDDPLRVYGMTFAGHEVRFRVSGDMLEVTEIV